MVPEGLGIVPGEVFRLNPFAVGLIVISAFMHAGWNLLSRHQMRPVLFLYRLLAVVSAAGLVPAVVSETLTRSMPPAAWLCATGSGLCCGVYYYGLARAYHAADFTTTYPLVRALPVLLVALADVLLGRYPTPAGWTGLVLVVAGCLLTPLRSFRDVRFARYWNHSFLWILLAALGTVGYSILDKQAAEIVQPGPATALRYCYFYFVVSWLSLAVIVHGFDRQQLRDGPVRWSKATLGAVLNFGGYSLVLWAYQLSRHVSYVLALRQFSIVIGVILAFNLFREQGRAVRLTGTACILAGMLLIAIWGK